MSKRTSHRVMPTQQTIEDEIERLEALLKIIAAGEFVDPRRIWWSGAGRVVVEVDPGEWL